MTTTTTTTTTATKNRQLTWARRLALLGSAAAVAVGSGALLSTAQQVPPPAPPAEPTTQPAGPTAPSPNIGQAPSLTIPPRSTRPATTQISFNFKDAPVDAVLERLSQDAGFIIVKESPIQGRVTILSGQPITPEEAVSSLNTVLKSSGSGYTVARTGRTLKVLTVAAYKKANPPVNFGADIKDIPETDDIVTQIVPVRSVDAVKLKADLLPLVGSDTDLASNAGSNSIIITDTQANIRRVVNIIAMLDKKDALESGIRIKQLKYADATATAKLITDLFKAPDQSSNGNGQNGGFNPGSFFRGFGGGGGGQGGGGFGGGGGGFGGGGGRGGGGGSGQAADEKGRTGTILAEADTRTNTVVITGPTDTLTIIDGVLAQLDNNPITDQTFFLYKVKNGSAADIAATVNTLFGVSISTGSSSNNRTSSSASSNRLGSSGSGSSSSGFGSSATGSSGFGSSSSSSGRSSSSSSGTSGRSSTGGGNGGGGAFGGFGAGGGSSGSGTNGVEAALNGQVQVVPDVDTNQLLVATASKYESQVRALLDSLDRPVPQVLIKVLVAEVTHDRSDDLGADFSILNLRASGQGENIGSTFGNATAQTTGGGVAIAILEQRVSATIHALATAGKLDVLSRPYILTSDNQEAYVLVGSEVPIITNSQVTDLGAIVNTVKYQSIGISLDVTPHINPDGLVSMDVSPQISSISDQTVTVSTGITSPVFNNRQAESHVQIKDGETIVIGGLMQDQKTQTISKIPILGDIPYIGLIFQRDQVTKTKTELLLFLTPHVAMDPDRLQGMSNDEVRGLQMTPNAVQPGTFQDNIEGLRRGGSATQPAMPVPKVKRDRDAWEPEPRMP